MPGKIFGDRYLQLTIKDADRLLEALPNARWQRRNFEKFCEHDTLTKVRALLEDDNLHNAELLSILEQCNFTKRDRALLIGPYSEVGTRRFKNETAWDQWRRGILQSLRGVVNNDAIIIPKAEYKELKNAKAAPKRIVTENQNLRRLLDPFLDTPVHEVFSSTYLTAVRFGEVPNQRTLTRILTFCANEKITTLRELVRCTERWVKQRPGIAEQSRSLMERVLQHFDLKLGMYPKDLARDI